MEQTEAAPSVGHNHLRVDALAEIAALAQPLGPADLSVNFDKYRDFCHFDGRSSF